MAPVGQMVSFRCQIISSVQIFNAARQLSHIEAAPDKIWISLTGLLDWLETVPTFLYFVLKYLHKN